ncbi:MAG TPA: UvrD-helicase domain-containing protein [Caulobacteraceae bacterium]
MSLASDAAARTRALTDLGASLLVEAGAGTGKTSLLAGRLALLLASGADPRHVAAITFTELAAADLGARVRQTIDGLLAGRTPSSLLAVLPRGLSADQAARLRLASERLDGLTTATIHGFCQELIRGYAVEADIDPGAQVLDRDAADLAFDQVFEAWLQRRLSVGPQPRDPIAVLARDDPRGMAATLRALARFRRRHRSARAPALDLGGRPDTILQDAVQGFRRWATHAPPEPGTLQLAEEFETLSAFYEGAFAAAPTFAELWRLAHPPALKCMRRGAFEFVRPRRLAIWKRLAGEADGARLEAESLEAFDQVRDAFAELLGRLGAALVAMLSAELDEVLADYAAFKRAAAVLDFDDLLETAGRLLRGHERVRAALAARYRHLLVDEFQDTDPLQCDIIFRLTTDEPWTDWRRIAPRAGALFLVGDPKQAIYQFRGADVGAYEAAKATFLAAWPDNLLRVSANFRSRRGILDHVNAVFAAPFDVAGQPGNSPLDATRENLADLPAAARLTLKVAPTARRDEIQEAEAEAVAQICARLAGSAAIADDLGRTRPVTLGDIALLAPTGTDLWRYERALERANLSFASQAGKGLLRRQEAQDLLALARTLASGRDTLAFGALMRGPLVGLTDEAILDIAEALPETPAGRPRFTVFTPSAHVADPAVAAVLEALQGIRRRIRMTSPVQLLTEAMERLNVRAILSMRDPRHAPTVNANIDALLERASRYGVRGLARFVEDLTVDWRSGAQMGEGRPDADGAAIEIVTIHSAKGLEWPIVVVINSAVGFRPRDALVHQPADDSLHWMMGDVAPPALAAAVQAEADSLSRERARLWYVACTRAQDLLIVPRSPKADARVWAGAVDLRLQDLPELDLGGLARAPVAAVEPPANLQHAAAFAEQGRRIAAAAAPIVWVRPSDHDGDRAPVVEVVAEDVDEGGDVVEAVGAGRLRGLVLHKLLEEVLAEGLPQTREDLARRAAVLDPEVELLRGEAPARLDPDELAATVLRTLALPEIAAIRPRLRAEISVYGLVGSPEAPAPMAGRADAIAVDAEGRPEAVVDWKSDVSPTASQFEAHVGQVRLYLAATGAPRGLLVYMSLGLVRVVEPAR